MIDGVGPESAREPVATGSEIRLPAASEDVNIDTPEIATERARGWARGLSNQDLLKEYNAIAQEARRYEEGLPGLKVTTPAAAFVSALLLASTIPTEGMPSFLDLVRKGDAVQVVLSDRLNGIIEELYARDENRFAEAYRAYLGLVAERQTGIVKSLIAKGWHKLSEYLGPDLLKRHLNGLLSSAPDHLKTTIRAQTAVHFLGY